MQAQCKISRDTKLLHGGFGAFLPALIILNYLSKGGDKYET